MDVIENNKLIAKFMGEGYVKWAFDSGLSWVSARIQNKGTRFAFGNYNNIPYHTSWDWLMPVVEKIAGDYHKTEIYSDEEADACRITVYVDGEYSHEIFECGLTTKEATYKAVISFIKWYNK